MQGSLDTQTSRIKKGLNELAALVWKYSFPYVLKQAWFVLVLVLAYVFSKGDFSNLVLAFFTFAGGIVVDSFFAAKKSYDINDGMLGIAFIWTVFCLFCTVVFLCALCWVLIDTNYSNAHYFQLLKVATWIFSTMICFTPLLEGIICCNEGHTCCGSEN